MPAAHSQRGIALKALGRLDEALASAERALAQQPDLAEAHASRGHVLKAMARAAEAEASFKRAAELNPKFENLAGKA